MCHLVYGILLCQHEFAELVFAASLLGRCTLVLPCLWIQTEASTLWGLEPASAQIGSWTTASLVAKSLDLV